MSRHSLRTLPKRGSDITGIVQLTTIAVIMGFARADLIAHVPGSMLPTILLGIIALCALVSIELAFDGPLATLIVDRWMRR